MAMSTRKTTEIGNLPCDLVICIFLCLPIKSLLRCLLVCKSFRAIIRSRNFLQLHLGRQDDFILISHYPITEPNLTPKHSMNHYRIHDLAFTKSLEAQHPLESKRSVQHIGSCRGLICFLGSTNVYFWNPAIRKFKTTSLVYREEATCSVKNTIGYGFVPRINGFKLVRLKRDGIATGKVLHEVDVYTLGSNTWRRIKDCVSGTVKNSYQASVNGIVYWTAEVKRSGESRYNYILGFSLDKEVFHELALPDNFSNYGLHEYKDTLCIHNLCHGEVCEIWMKKDQCTAHPWLKLYTFKLHNFPDYDPGLSILMKNDELLIPGGWGTLSLCDPKDGQLIKKDIPPLKDINLPEIENYSVKALNYTESLVLLD